MTLSVKIKKYIFNGLWMVQIICPLHFFKRRTTRRMIQKVIIGSGTLNTYITLKLVQFFDLPSPSKSSLLRFGFFREKLLFKIVLLSILMFLLNLMLTKLLEMDIKNFPLSQNFWKKVSKFPN